MFSIVKRSRLSFKAPQFKCDDCISDKIAEPLPSKAAFLCISGSAGSGKTSLMLNLLTDKHAYRKAFQSVHVVMPPHSIASLKNNIFKRHDKVYDELDWDTLEKISERVKKDAEDDYNSLLILDDVTTSLKNLDVQRQLSDLIKNRRHYHLTIWLLVQTYNAIPLNVRKTISHLVLFRPRNQSEFRNVSEELLFYDRQDAEILKQYVYDSAYNFLFADVDKGLVYKNFDMLEKHA